MAIYGVSVRNSVTSKNLPNVCKSSPKIISLEKLKILTPFQELPKNVGDLGKLIVATGLKSCPKSKKSPNLVTLVRSWIISVAANSKTINSEQAIIP